MDIQTEILVIGAGPSAASFAERMRQNGKKITVISETRIDDAPLFSRLAKIQGLDKFWKLANSQRDFELNETAHKNFLHFSGKGSGGLSNRWGGGLAKLSALDLSVPKGVSEAITEYYDFAESLIGHLATYSDRLNGYLGRFDGFDSHGTKGEVGDRAILPKSTTHVQPGLTRQAVNRVKLERNLVDACNGCGQCTVVCARGSFYNANRTMLTLKNFHDVIENCRATKIEKASDGRFRIFCETDDDTFLLHAEKIVLAAGPVASAKLATTGLGLDKVETRLLFTPSVRGLIFKPFQPKRQKRTVGEVVAKVKISDRENAYVAFIDGETIPVSDWLSMLPLRLPIVASLLRRIRRFFVAYIIFLDSDFGEARLSISGDRVYIEGGHRNQFRKIQRTLKRRLNWYFLKNFSFDIFAVRAVLTPGQDIHYGGTIPMLEDGALCVGPDCRLHAEKNIYVIDASWMPRMSEKPHTFTLMANAARIADTMV